MNQIKNEEPLQYIINKATKKTKEGDEIIEQAINILRERLEINGAFLSKCEDSKNYVTMMISHLEYEVFGVLFLNNQNRLIKSEIMFRGTINESSVYPREVIKRALQLNAAAMIFYHNHPSQSTEASKADVAITNKLIKAASTFNIRVLDHIIAGGVNTMSFAEDGLI